MFTPPVSGPVTSPERPTRERSPAGKGPRGKGRVSAADDLGDLLASVGGFLMRTDQYQATGRMIAFQSDASGQLLDEAMAGTLVDRVAIQRAVKARKSVDGVAAIVAPPLLVWAIENDIHKQQAAERVGAVVPSRIPALVPLLEAALRQSAKVMVPAVKKVRKREADEAEALAELFPDAEPGSDPVAGLINEIFPGIYAALANAAEPHTEGVTL